VLAFGFADWHGVLLPVAADDSAADRVASLEPVPVEAFPPVEAGFSLVSPASGVEAEPPFAGEVVTVGVGVGLTGGDVEVDGGVVLGLVDPVVGSVDWKGGPVEACPELYGVALGLGVHDGELLGERDAEE
jgi:hypothetical protein